MDDRNAKIPSGGNNKLPDNSKMTVDVDRKEKIYVIKNKRNFPLMFNAYGKHCHVDPGKTAEINETVFTSQQFKDIMKDFAIIDKDEYEKNAKKAKGGEK